MSALHLDPRAEHDALYDALGLFQARWEQQRTAQAVFDFCEAVERANEAVTVCERQKSEQDQEFRFQVVRLKVLLTAAVREHEQIRRGTLEDSGQRLAAEAPEGRALDTVFAPGT